MDKQDIKNFTLKELEKIIADMGESPYRARQIFLWLYKKGVDYFTEMNNLSSGLVKKLNQDYYIGIFRLQQHLQSKEATEKFLFELPDGNFIETVLIHSKSRNTVCLSTQAGCKFACSFCASGRIRFIRDLTASEIVSQPLFLQHKQGHKITNCVFMGMGEPLDNYENTSKAMLIMNDPNGLAVGARRITVSTCGVVPGINKLKELGLQVNLSLSLHATNNKLRDEIMPINKLYPLQELIDACRHYTEETKRLITIEYILLKNKNDSLKDADALAQIAKKLKGKINLIAYSEIADLHFQPPEPGGITLFMERLKKNKVNVTLRKSKGKDIQASCGQLAGRKRC